jgi:hypothetical protein
MYQPEGTFGGEASEIVQVNLGHSQLNAAFLSTARGTREARDDLEIS